MGQSKIYTCKNCTGEFTKWNYEYNEYNSTVERCFCCEDCIKSFEFHHRQNEELDDAIIKHSISVNGSSDQWTWSCYDKGLPYHETTLKIFKNGILYYSKLVRHDWDNSIYTNVTHPLVSRFLRRYSDRLMDVNSK